MNYPSIRIEGGILSPDVFERLDDAAGQQPVDFGLESSVKVKDEIARAWADAQDYWRIFQRKLESLKAESPATTETRNNWIVPLLGLLGYQLEYQARGTELNGKNYPISHRATNRNQTPVHIVGCREPAGLDRKPEKSALRMSAHAMVQEYLNLTDQLFGVATNGRVLRLLRDSSRLIKLSYLEFDLDRIFADGLFADFAMLYRLLHASRLPQSAEAVSSCWLERYHQDTIEQGTRIREGLRAAVTEALELLGTGFISDPNNGILRQQIESKQLAAEDFFKYILRLVYRLLFLMVTEERGLVFPKGTPTKHINIYFQYYSVQRLRRLALTRGLKIERCHDAWLSLLSTFRLFEHPDTAAKLGITALIGQLFHPESLGILAGCRLSNAALLSALDRLCNFNHPKTGQRMPVNFGALATEEFGSVYESLLELHPLVEVQPIPLFRFKQAAGNERKTTGSYYTPTSLVDCLLDSALDPVLDNRIREFYKLGYTSAEAAILAIKVCDPACGSGHFLIAAAQRIARRLARVRSGDDEPSPQVMRHALREVIGHCIYGVDINPMSAELCKVALWMEAMEPGKPLSFLDHHIQCGNSLLGTTPALMAKGISDDAFTAIEGDLKARVTELKKQNKKERQEFANRQGYLFEPPKKLGNIAADFAKLGMAPDETVEDVAAMQTRYAELVRNSDYQYGRLLADVWCSTFVWKKDDSELGKMCPTERDFRKVESHAAAGLLPHVSKEVERQRDQYQFFHWHLAFPDVFRLPSPGETPENERTGWNGGFDVLLGNPPWERVQFEERAFFSEKHPEIEGERNQSRRRTMIAALAQTDPGLFRLWRETSRHIEGEAQLLRLSNRFPLSAVDKFNLYAVFLELATQLYERNGRIGIIVKAGYISDSLCAELFASTMKNRQLAAVAEFENRANLFPGVDSRERFALVTLAHDMPTADFAFDNHIVDELRDEQRHIAMSYEDILQLSPNTKNCPKFSDRREYDVTRRCYDRFRPFRTTVPATNPWDISIDRYINVSDFSDSIVTANELEGIAPAAFDTDSRLAPLYEGKLFHQFDHRFATYGSNGETCEGVDKSADARVAFYRFIPSDIAKRRNPRLDYGHGFLVARDITNRTNERGVIAAIIPAQISDYTVRVVQIDSDDGVRQLLLLSILNSFVLDYLARQRIGGTHLSNYVLEQLPVPAPDEFDSMTCGMLFANSLELTYTAWDLAPFAKHCGYSGSPFPWNEERRFLLRAELDAAFFHLYGINHDDTAYILDTFPIVRRKDIARTEVKNQSGDVIQSGTYITKETILRIYDAMAEAIRTGQPYQTVLDPPPADPRAAHSPRMHQLTYGDVVADILLLLREWDSAVSILALEPAVLLMQNEEARNTFTGRVQQKATITRGDHNFKVVEGIDLVYQGLVFNGAIEPVGQNGYRLLRPELIAGLSPENQQRARQVVEAIKMLDRPEDALPLVVEVTHERYSVAVS